MGKATYGTGTLFKRGRIWYVSYYVNGRQVQRSSRSNNIQDAKRVRDQILGQTARGEMGRFGQSEKITCNELLDDLLEYGKSNIKPSTAHIWGLVIKANIRPFFGHLKAATLTTEKLKDYRCLAVGGGAERGHLQPRTLNSPYGAQPGPEMHTAESHHHPALPDGCRDECPAGIPQR